MFGKLMPYEFVNEGVYGRPVPVSANQNMCGICAIDSCLILLLILSLVYNGSSFSEHIYDFIMNWLDCGVSL
jgi:hypothetical protein